MNCPGSNVLLKTIGVVEESDEEDYRTNGIAAHEAAAHCLIRDKDAWEIIDEEFHKTKVDVEIADAIQQYVDYCRPLMPGASYFVEERIGEEPRPHPKFYGTTDFAAVDGKHLTVVDYKHGQGIIVEPHENPQAMYYAYGMLRRFPRVETVKIVIAQPRAFHHEGTIREWDTEAAHINTWAEEQLLPAMARAEIDNELNPGPWCRFCPAKLACPMLRGMFGAAALTDPRVAETMTDDMLGVEYTLMAAVKMYQKAIEDEALRRLNRGAKITGIKLVDKRANRVWKTGALEFLKEKFGNDAYEPVSMKSPPEIEKLGPAGKEAAKLFAYKPATGFTVALDDDNRSEVIVQSAQERFAALATAGESGQNGETNE